MRHRVAAILIASALAVSAPVAFADPGGVPHTTRACPDRAVGHAQGPKQAAHNTKGNKCGFNRGV